MRAQHIFYAANAQWNRETVQNGEARASGVEIETPRAAQQTEQYWNANDVGNEVVMHLRYMLRLGSRRVQIGGRSARGL